MVVEWLREEAITETGVRDKDPGHEGLNVESGGFPVNRAGAIRLDQIIQLVVGRAVVDFVEVDGVANPGSETSESIIIL